MLPRLYIPPSGLLHIFIYEQTYFFSPCSVLYHYSHLYLLWTIFSSSSYTCILITYRVASDLSERRVDRQRRQLAVRYGLIAVFSWLRSRCISQENSVDYEQWKAWSLNLIHYCIHLNISNFPITLYRLSLTVSSRSAFWNLRKSKWYQLA